MKNKSEKKQREKKEKRETLARSCCYLLLEFYFLVFALVVSNLVPVYPELFASVSLCALQHEHYSDTYIKFTLIFRVAIAPFISTA